MVDVCQRKTNKRARGVGVGVVGGLVGTQEYAFFMVYEKCDYRYAYSFDNDDSIDDFGFASITQ